MAAEEHEITLLTCFISTSLSEVRMNDGSRVYLRHKTAEYKHLEGRRGIAVIDGGALVEFRPHPE